MLEKERGSPTLPESTASTLDECQLGNLSANRRLVVEARYKVILKERENNPDRITTDGAGLDSIDPSKPLNYPPGSRRPRRLPLSQTW